MILSHRHKFVFVHIPKTAGTSVTESLRPMLDEGDICGDGSAVHPLLHYHAPAWEIAEAMAALGLDVNAFKWFTVMRNPFEILHSDYWFHRYIGERLYPINPPEKDNPEYEWHLKCHRSQFQTFGEYVRLAYGHWDKGFFDNYTKTRDGRRRPVRMILRQDTLADQWPHLLHYLGVNHVPLLRVNATEHVDGRKRPPPQQDYDDETRLWVEDRFAKALRWGDYTLENAR